MSETNTRARPRDGAAVASQATATLSASFPGASAGQLDKLRTYFATLDKWSSLHNLTGATGPKERLGLLCDCAPLVSRAAGTQGDICDVGSGAGLPGIPLAVMLPGRRVHLVEGEASKAAFLEQARIEAGLGNLAVFHGRVESWRPGNKMGLVCARGFMSLAGTVRACAEVIGPGTVLLSLKPKDPVDEMRELLCAHPGWDVRCEPLSDTAPSRFLVEARAMR